VGTISYLHDGQVTNYPVKLGNSTSVHAFATGPDGTVWASTPNAILRFDGRLWREVKGDFGFSFGEGRGGVWSFGVGRDGVVWSKNPDGLFYLKPGQDQFARAPGHSGGPEGFTTTPDGRLWTSDVRIGHLYPMPDLMAGGMGDVWRTNRGWLFPQALKGLCCLTGTEPCGAPGWAAKGSGVCARCRVRRSLTRGPTAMTRGAGRAVSPRIWSIRCSRTGKAMSGSGQALGWNGSARPISSPK
jgi:hypothetical protein